MNDKGKNWIKSFIIGIVVAVTGCTGIGSIVGGFVSVASGEPIGAVVKDVATDSIKNTALNTLYGNKDDEDSVATMFDRNKYNYVSDKKSGPIGWIAPGWYAECYGIESDAYFGNRRYNKANDVNFKWDMSNASNFEVGNFKNNVAYSNSYIAYDSDNFKLVIGELKKAKLNGYILVYDEYYNNYELVEYKKGKETGYKIGQTDDKVYYIKNDENIAIYDDTSKKFAHFSAFSKKQPSVQINKINGGYEFDFENYSFKLFNNEDYVEYSSQSTEFKGNAFSFKCDYNYKEDEAVTYTYETMQRVKMECTDGTVGELLAIDESDNSKEAITAKSISVALIKIGAHATVDVLIEGDLALLDTAVELATGVSISSTINYQIDNVIDDVFDENSELNKNVNNIAEKIDNVGDNLTNLDDPRSLEDKVKDGLGLEENRNDFEDSTKITNEDGSTTFILPSGVKVTVE